MKLFSNGISSKIVHLIDRLPETDEDLKYLCRLFPGTIVLRKSNNWSCLLSEAKLKNLHWYK